MERCPICSGTAEVTGRSDERLCECGKCGKFVVDHAAELLLPRPGAVQRSILSEFVRKQNEFGRTPRIGAESLESILIS